MVFRATITIEWNGWGQPSCSMVFRWFGSLNHRVLMVFRWLSTIGQTMRWTIAPVFCGGNLWKLWSNDQNLGSWWWSIQWLGSLGWRRPWSRRCPSFRWWRPGCSSPGPFNDHDIWHLQQGGPFLSFVDHKFLSRMIDRLTWTAMTERTSTVILLNSSKQPHAPVWARPWTIYHYEWYCDTLWYIILHYSIALWYITMHNNISLFHKIYHYAKLHDIAKRRRFQNCTLHNVLFVQYDGPVVFWLKP